jgi:hypothetical protein
MNKIALCLLLIAVVLISGCVGSPESKDGTEISLQSGAGQQDAQQGQAQATPSEKQVQPAGQEQKPDASEQSQVSGDVIDAVFKECDVSRDTPIGRIHKIDENCLYEKATSVDMCRAYQGREIYSSYAATRDFDSNKVDSCVMSLAVKNKDSKLCKEAGSLKQTCYENLAINLKNPSICVEAADKNHCYENYIGTIGIDNSKCREQYGNHLISLVACVYPELSVPNDSSLSDQSLCTLWAPSQNFGAADNGKQICTAARGAYLQDTSICNQAGDYKGDCYTAISKFSSSFTTSDCDKAGTAYVSCYISLAIRNSDAAICDKVPTASKGACVEQVAVSTKNFALCVGLGASTPEGFHCAQLTAGQINRADYTYQFCDDVSKFKSGIGVSANQCFYEVGTRTLSIDACNRIVGEDSAKQTCTELVQHAQQSG